MIKRMVIAPSSKKEPILVTGSNKLLAKPGIHFAIAAWSEKELISFPTLL